MTQRSIFRKTETPEDLDRVIDTIVLAFRDDPTWAPLLIADQNDLSASHAYWSLFIRSSFRYPETYQNEDGTVAAVWLPPNGSELTPEEEAGLEDFAIELFGTETKDLLFKTFEGFEGATPKGEFYYLSLLGVHPSRRGEGLGMQLLADNLKQYDELGVPTYLESSNSINDVKYKRLGYEQHGTFLTGTGTRVNTFWRDPQ